MSYTIGSHQVTYTDQAPAEIAGTTATLWFVADKHGRQVHSGLASKAAAVEAMETRLYEDAEIPVALANGVAVYVPRRGADRFRGIDNAGNRVYAMDLPGDDYLVPLTPCCNATGKGSPSPTGVVCRACKRTVSSYFGGPAIVAVPRAS